MSGTIEDPPLSQGVAYGIVLGFGIAFALLMNGITWMSRKYLHESNASYGPIEILNRIFN